MFSHSWIQLQSTWTYYQLNRSLNTILCASLTPLCLDMVGSMPQYNNFHPSHTSAVLEPRHLVEDTWDYSLDSYSDVTNWGKRANPPSQTRYRTWTHLVCILVLVFFWFSELCFFFELFFHDWGAMPSTTGINIIFQFFCVLVTKTPTVASDLSANFPPGSKVYLCHCPHCGWLVWETVASFTNGTFCVKPKLGVCDGRDTLCDACDTRLFWSILRISFW